ncbi:hypothetical protein [Ralstonia phage RP31]|uniref:Uncharacterized protein n=2 Tax=Ripduovirus RP12 TaxID=2560700 RepID=A0A1L7N113_9CAUD|nr:hypothetical protein FDH28_gp227 [Ralstonia phage RP12]BAW19168.1 hypothetical protein [Ralstonia phage RP12]BAW19454.1 hypothetical protein [Ralstonia phage RP31]
MKASIIGGVLMLAILGGLYFATNQSQAPVEAAPAAAEPAAQDSGYKL